MLQWHCRGCTHAHERIMKVQCPNAMPRAPANQVTKLVRLRVHVYKRMYMHLEVYTQKRHQRTRTYTYTRYESLIHAGRTSRLLSLSISPGYEGFIFSVAIPKVAMRCQCGDAGVVQGDYHVHHDVTALNDGDMDRGPQCDR